MHPTTYEHKVFDIVLNSLKRTSVPPAAGPQEFWPENEQETFDNEWMWREKM